MTIHRSAGWLGFDSECDPIHRRPGRSPPSSAHSNPKWWMPSGQRSNRCSRDRTRRHPLGCHRPRVPDRLCFWGILVRLDHRLVVGRHRSDPRTPGLGHDTAGPPRRVDRGRRVRPDLGSKRSPRSIGSWVSISTRSPSTGRCTRPPTVAKDTGRNPTDRGKLGWKWSSRSTVTASRSAGRSTARTATTSNCSHRPSPPSTPTGLDRRDRDPAPRPRLRLPRHPTPSSPTLGLADHDHPTPQDQAGDARHSRSRLGLRWIVEAANSGVELRPAPPQHRPQDLPPPRRTLPRHHHPDRRQTPHLPRPMEPDSSAYPLGSLVWCCPLGVPPDDRLVPVRARPEQAAKPGSSERRRRAASAGSRCVLARLPVPGAAQPIPPRSRSEAHERPQHKFRLSVHERTGTPERAEGTCHLRVDVVAEGVSWMAQRPVPLRVTSRASPLPAPDASPAGDETATGPPSTPIRCAGHDPRSAGAKKLGFEARAVGRRIVAADVEPLDHHGAAERRRLDGATHDDPRGRSRP